MQLPIEIDKVTLDRHWRHRNPYPPLGFIPFSENQLGNGDTFGLYWPIGRESSEPLVAEIWHDEWSLQPTYSSLGSFLKAAADVGDDQPDVPTTGDDPSSPRACLNNARQHVALRQPQAAILLLERAIAVLPEYTDALSLLCSQYGQVGRADEAARIAVQAIISPPSFGERPQRALRWLCSPASPSLDGDPIWQSRRDLKLSFGGVKQNSDYPVLLEAINQYLEQADFGRASTLMQTYAELMNRETTAFQARYGFDRSKFVEWQIEVSKNLPGGARDAGF